MKSGWLVPGISGRGAFVRTIAPHLCYSQQTLFSILSIRLAEEFESVGAEQGFQLGLDSVGLVPP